MSRLNLNHAQLYWMLNKHEPNRPFHGIRTILYREKLK
jgi:hypothetical protein